ncbi:ATP-binding protein [Litchfieldella rifensis]|uniref:ATP-binding protein n=1 Tax=Litchfieldella rifensis TaxID=762643 RepID=A0ABV7LUP9_9GAMM
MKMEFDLTPDPRVLQVLGDISLDQWKCLAELVDNSVDGFVNAKRRSEGIDSPEVVITLPTADSDDAFISLRDNGPGMSTEQLEVAARAGWSGNNPFDNLGLFGMGFNIATARLGVVTEVYSTRKGDNEWTGLRIDLEELRRSRDYHTPLLTKPKADPDTHGTEIRILRLKRDQRRFFSRGANIRAIRKKLAHIYAPLLLAEDSRFRLDINGQQVQPQRHCHWSPDRHTQGPDGRPVHAVETIDVKLAPRRYCSNCMLTLMMDEESCPTCRSIETITEIQRRLHGWVGLQRYMHEDEYGIDLIRNGRIIEARSKDLFFWSDGERQEREYPIDDQRNRGRFIGEVHMDHCRVHYTKDRFERDDPAWREMVHLVRGEGPLLPRKRRDLGFPETNAPLYRLFQAFRRSSPQGKAGRWERIIAVKNNDRAVEMADLFQKGDPEYQTDEKWWELVLEQDRSVVGAISQSNEPTSNPPDLPEGLLDEGDDDGGGNEGDTVVAPPVAPPTVHLREKLHALSRTYSHSLIKVEFAVEAFAVEAEAPDLPDGAPWTFRMDDPATRVYQYLVQRDHPVFRSTTMTPLDGLLNELALKTYEFLKDHRPTDAVFAAILADLRSQYARESQLDSGDLIASACATLRDIGSSVAENLGANEANDCFDSLPSEMKTRIGRKVATSGATALKTVVQSGDFLSYAEPDDVRRFVREHPSLFFDGRYWEQLYDALDFGDASITAEGRARVSEQYDSYLADAVWLASQSPADIDRAPREAVIRAAQSLRLLAPDRGS